MAAEPTTRDVGAAASASPAPTPPSAPMPLEAPKIPAGGPWQDPTQAPPPTVPKLEAPPPTLSTPPGDARVGALPPTTVPGTASQPVHKPTKPSSHANRVKNVALAALTGGSIGLPAQETPAPGFLPAGGGNRKVIPELVLPFPLPCEETVVASEATMDMDSSVVCLQALRQTRMMHMLQILPPYSHRQRAGMEFYEVVPPSLLPGIHPRSAHTLLSLGRADVHVGPMTYYGVRFWHLRPAPAPTMPRVQRPVCPPEAGQPPMAHGPGPQTAAHVRPPGPSEPAQAHAPAPTPQGAGSGSLPETPRPPPATAASSTQPSQPQGHPPPPQAQPPPPLDAGFVARLQQRAERDPHLQHLLQLARAGQLPEQGMVQLNTILASLITPPVPPPEERAPPVVLVEFPENPSLQLVLPLWHAAVERTHATGQASSVVLSFFAPAIGSKAAGESGKEEAQAAVHGMLVRHMSHVSSAPPPPPPPAPTKEEADPAAAPAAAPAPKRRRTGARGKNVKGEQAAPPTRNHELFPLTWRITSEQGVDERLWDCLGRVPGCLTNGAWASPSDERVFAAIKASFAQRKRTMPALHRLPPRLCATDIPPGLVDHVQDRYAMRMAVHTHRPQPKRKVAMLSDTKGANHARSMEPAPRAPVIGEDGVKRKRKRHVATHNPDGSLKSCGACGKTKTPMWRRGPKGPSQLCNACGAKWKAGRLVVPEVPPPPILNDVLPVRHVKPPIASVPPMMPVPQVPSSLSGGVPVPRQNAPPGHPTPMPAPYNVEVRPPSGEAATSSPLPHMPPGTAASEPRHEVHAPAEAPATAPPPPGTSTPTPPAP